MLRAAARPRRRRSTPRRAGRRRSRSGAAAPLYGKGRERPGARGRGCSFTPQEAHRGDTGTRHRRQRRWKSRSSTRGVPVSTATLSPPRPSPTRHRATPPTSRRRQLLRGPADDPRWLRPALLALLAATALLYLWDLPASGYANDYYAAAVQAATQSLKAWLFGSLDSGNAITVDKPPAALWVMTASARLFGFSSWSLLVPQALMGVASVGLLYGAVRRWAGPVAGLIAGAVLALTPAAVLMFRFDNPDALLTLLLVTGAYTVVRAIDAASVRASTWWLVGAGAAVGFG
ncbi:MAG: glycosyltransferase family 39 protein, partial [Pseudonocardia sp.]|nr:glycosyltransferase family 39 protein [Pseudonocardia sp.]